MRDVPKYEFTREQVREFRKQYLGECEPCVINMLGAMTILTALSKVKDGETGNPEKVEELGQLFGEGAISYRDLARATAEVVPEKVKEKILEMLQWAEALDLPVEMGIGGIDFEAEEHEHKEWEMP